MQTSRRSSASSGDEHRPLLGSLDFRRKACRAVPKNVAVVLAGGVGARVGLTIPKQLIKIAGRTILEHTLAALESHELVDEIIVMMAPGHLDAVREIVRGGSYPKVMTILEGAETRNGTTSRALDAIPGDDTVPYRRTGQPQAKRTLR